MRCILLKKDNHMTNEGKILENELEAWNKRWKGVEDASVKMVIGTVWYLLKCIKGKKDLKLTQRKIL